MILIRFLWIKYVREVCLCAWIDGYVLSCEKLFGWFAGIINVCFSRGCSFLRSFRSRLGFLSLSLSLFLCLSFSPSLSLSLSNFFSVFLSLSLSLSLFAVEFVISLSVCLGVGVNASGGAHICIDAEVGVFSGWCCVCCWYLVLFLVIVPVLVWVLALSVLAMLVVLLALVMNCQVCYETWSWRSMWVALIKMPGMILKEFTLLLGEVYL